MARHVAKRYGGVAQTLHWLTAGLILVLIPLGFYMEGLPLGQLKFDLYQVHKSIGLTVMLLVLVRLAWRSRHPAPPFPASMPVSQRFWARLTHWALYGLLIAQPMIGFLHSNAANFPVVFWGLVPLPAMIGQSETLAGILISIHVAIGFAITFLLVLHISAALYHHFIKRDDVLLRMLPQTR